MKELSLNILDVSENSVKAGAKNVEILITEDENTMTLEINDDGCGMDAETLEKVTDPFFTTRTTRDVGLGIPFLKLAAEQTGGSLEIISRCVKDCPDNHGTKIKAVFNKNHIDFTPLGDIASTIVTLVQGAADIDFKFIHKTTEKEIDFDTKELRSVLGDDVPLNSMAVIQWIMQYFREEYCS